MSHSIITKKRIAKEFKQLVIADGLQAMSISTLMKNIGMRRQSFYNYFIDKYDLVDWIFQQENTELIDDNIEYSRWEEIIVNLINHFKLNRMFYKQVFTYSGQNSFKKYLKDHTVNLVEKIYLFRHPHLRAEFEQQPNNYNLLITIYANGIVESTIDWILNEPESSEEQFSKNIINYINILLDSLDEFAENTQ